MMERSIILEDENERLSTYKNCGALFLDRDGVIIEDMHYLADEDGVILINGVRELIQETKNNGNAVIVVTNQSGIGRGKFGWKEYNNVTAKILALLGEKAKPTAIYANGYTRDTHAWRKPNAGMLFQAKKDFGIDLKRSKIIGDRLTDIKAGVNAELEEAVQVLSGHGSQERNLVEMKIKDGRYINTRTRVRLKNNLSELINSDFWNIR